MRRTLLYVYLFLLAFTVPSARASLRGSWHGRLGSDHSLHLNLVREHNEFGHTFELSDLTGLSSAQLNGSGNTPVKFTLSRDAGAFVFEGIFGDGEGGGRFTFTANPAYAAELQSLGVASTKELDDERLFALAAIDVSRQFIREMQALGYRVSLEDYTRFRIHGATPQFVRDMQSAGYRSLSAEDLVRFRIHGVTTSLIKALQAEGYRDVSSDDLVRFCIHGVTADFVEAIHALGYRPAAEELVRFRIHGVSAEYLHSLKDLGYTPTAEQLVAMRIHNVSPEFIRSLKEAGYSAIPVEKLIEMRIHGIDAKYLKAMKSES